MGCWGPPGGQSCRENALSDFTAYFTTFFRKKIHSPMDFSTSSEILVEKRRRIILILWYRKVCGPPGAAFSREGSLLAVCALFRTASPSQSNPADLPALPKGEPLAGRLTFWKNCKVNGFARASPFGRGVTVGDGEGEAAGRKTNSLPTQTTKPGGPLRTARLCVKRSCYSSILPKLKSAKSSTRSVRLGATGAAVSASRGA